MAFRTKKSLGQHFLTDGNIVRKIVESLKGQRDDRIIEIGPGTGALTKWLAKGYSDLHVIEVDERAIEVLKNEIEGITIHEEDVLKSNWENLVNTESSNYVIGNLPYYITSPILFSVLEQRHLFKEAIFMMQKEVAERIVASHSTKEYGILSVQIQLMSTPEILFDVSPNSFSPPPKVDSTVIRLTFNKPALECSDKNLKRVVRTAFNQRRKKISNSLKPVLGDYQPEGFDFALRPENWSPETYAKLTAHLEDSGKLE